MPARLTIRLFGAPSIEVDGVAMRQKIRAVGLLALLAARRGAIPRAALAAAMWPDEIDSDARANLRRHVHILQSVLPAIEGVSWVEATATTVAWNADAPAWIDVRAFEEGAADPSRRAQALELYRGDLLEGSYDEYLLSDRERLRGIYVDACFEEALAARRDLRYRDAIAFTDRILSMDEWREDALRLGMALRYEAGDRTSALAQFDRFASMLRSSMRVEPMPETIALRDAILANAPVANVSRHETARDAAQREDRLPFVGRESDLAKLEAAWRRAAMGRGTTIFVGGEPGIGKTRLAAELAAVASAQGGRVLLGETSNPQAFPYEPLVDALRRGLPFVVESPVRGPWLSAVAELLPEIAAAFPALGPADPLPEAQAQARLFEALARTIEQLARARPLLLILEDLHWAQSATIDVLETLARRIGAVPALVVATYRTGEAAPGHPLHALRQRLQTQHLATTHQLHALRAESVGELVRKMPQFSARADELSAWLYGRSEGNPLFAGLLLRDFAESGSLDAGEATSTVAQTVVARIAALPGASRGLARCAAVAGRFFSADLLADVLGWGQGEALDALGALLDRGLVRASGASALAYGFSHALIEKAVYDETPLEERTALHRRIAGLLAQSGDPQSLATTARHWELGGEPARATRAYVAAAEAALAIYARAEACEDAARALALATGARDRFVALSLLSQAQAGAVDAHLWNATIEALYAQAQSLGDEERFHALTQRELYARTVGDNAGGRAALDEMVALANASLAQKRAIAYVTLGMFEIRMGRHGEALAALEEGLAAALASGDADAAMTAREGLIRVHSYAGDPAKPQEILEEMRAHVPDASPAQRQRLVRAELDVATLRDDFDGIERAALELLEFAESTGDLRLERSAHQQLAYARHYRSSVRVVRAHIERALELGRHIGAGTNRLYVLINAATFERYLGRTNEALAILDELFAELGPDSPPFAAPYIRVERAMVLLLQQRPAEALEALRHAMEEAVPTKDRRLLQLVSITRGRALIAAGQTERGLAEMREGFTNRWPSRAYLLEDLCAAAMTLFDAGLDPEAFAMADRVAAEFGGELRGVTEPTAIYWVLALAAHRRGAQSDAQRSIMLGRAALARELKRLDDPESVASVESLPHNRGLLEGFAPANQS